MSEAPLREVLDDEDRTPIEGAAPIVSLGDDDAPEWVAALEEHGRAVFELERRGHWHGRWVELDDAIDPRARLPRPSLCRRRFVEGRPLVLRGAVAESLPHWRNEVHAAERARERIANVDGFAGWLRARLGRGQAVALEQVAAGGADGERDVATARFAARGDAPAAWAKVGRLSTHAEDDSLRLRFGFGAEPDDDASTDAGGHRACLAAARAVLPEFAALEKDAPLFAAIDEIAPSDTALGPACPIAYWNRPGGGALFHHDAFAAVEDDARQFGVLYVQLAGATAWLAASTAQLARRVQQFAHLLDEGAMPWVLEALESSGGLDALRDFAGDPFALADELGRPGQGRLGPLVNRGPEFTALLADLGHAAVLRAGDAILLPNNGWRSTTMHSVFSASDGANYALSLGLRPRTQVGARRGSRRPRGR